MKRRSGFTLLEMSLTITIVAIIAGMGARMLSSYLDYYLTQSRYQESRNVFQIEMSRIYQALLVPLVKQVVKPLRQSSNATDHTIVLALSDNNRPNDPLQDDSSYVYQLTRVHWLKETGELRWQRLLPDGSDNALVADSEWLIEGRFQTYYDDLMLADPNFVSALALSVKVTDFTLEFFDVNETIIVESDWQTARSDIAVVKATITLAYKGLTMTRAFILSPWRLLITP